MEVRGEEGVDVAGYYGGEERSSPSLGVEGELLVNRLRLGGFAPRSTTRTNAATSTPAAPGGPIVNGDTGQTPRPSPRQDRGRTPTIATHTSHYWDHLEPQHPPL